MNIDFKVFTIMTMLPHVTFSAKNVSERSSGCFGPGGGLRILKLHNMQFRKLQATLRAKMGQIIR